MTHPDKKANLKLLLATNIVTVIKLVNSACGRFTPTIRSPLRQNAAAIALIPPPTNTPLM